MLPVIMTKDCFLAPQVFVLIPRCFLVKASINEKICAQLKTKVTEFKDLNLLFNFITFSQSLRLENLNYYFVTRVVNAMD